MYTDLDIIINGQSQCITFSSIVFLKFSKIKDNYKKKFKKSTFVLTIWKGIKNWKLLI